MKLAVVVQRYGREINGGAELHARYIAERLARHAEVDVLTTLARDYVTWRNEQLPAREDLNGVRIQRFPVDHERDLVAFSRASQRVFEETHSLDDELRWLDLEGPTSPALVRHVAERAGDYAFCLFFSYRYYQAYYGVRAAADRAVLVPTAERDAAIGLALFAPIFRGVRAVMYNSPEERAMIQAVSQNHDVPGTVVGVGSEVPADPQPERFRQKYGVTGRFAIYVGRIDGNKGCEELFDFFRRYVDESFGLLSLLLVGHSLLPIPRHSRIVHLGFLDDRDKFDAMAAADLLIVPSYFESLSMVTLESWALGRPVLVNGRCDVLKGQSLRSNAGFFYESYPEFLFALRALEASSSLRRALGENGRRFYHEHYRWAVIEQKYLDMLEHLRQTAPASNLAPIPPDGERRRPDLPPARDVVARLPSGPAGEAWGPGRRALAGTAS